LIETARHHVSVTANLAMVDSTGTSGLITQEMQKDEARAGYGRTWLNAGLHSQDYGSGFRSSVDMSASSGRSNSAATGGRIRRWRLPATGWQSPDNCQTRLTPRCCNSSASGWRIRCPQICQNRLANYREKEDSATGCELPSGQILSLTGVSPSERIIIDFRSTSALADPYRMLLSISDPARRFYFEQAATQHWSKENPRQIDKVVERVASLGTRLDSAQEQAGPAI
jgi:hypothetical protein